MNTNTLRKIQSEPKGNFHLHLTGALSASDLRELASLRDYDISEFEPLEIHYKFNSKVIWSIAKDLTSNAQGLLLAIQKVVLKELADSVVYIELTINAHGLLRRGMSEKQIINCLCEGVAFASRHKVILKYKVGINRKDGNDTVNDVIGLFNAMPGSAKICIDINGDERKYPAGEVIEKIASSVPSKSISIHSGEGVGLCSSLRSAIALKPLRIAHATCLSECIDCIHMLKQSDTVLEICPSSNVATNAVTHYLRLPISLLIREKIPFVMGTDDPAFFNLSISHEYSTLCEFGFSEDMILEKMKNDLAKFKT